MTPLRRRWRLVLLGAGILAFAAFSVLVHRIADAVRGAPIDHVADGPGRGAPALSDPAFLDVLASVSETDMGGGHQVELLSDRAFFERLLPELHAARRSITLLTYYCEPGTLADAILATLEARAIAGVEVLVLADGFGCGDLISEEGERMRAAGVAMVPFRPVRWHTLHRAQHRMHARSVVVDGTVAYTGGFGIADKWTVGDPGQSPWRDTGVRYTGPAVRATQAYFLAAWAEATGELRSGEDLFTTELRPGEDLFGEPSLPGEEPGRPRGDVAEGDVRGAGAMAGLVYSQPTIGTTVADRFLALTLAGAERTLYVSNSYFVPTPLVRDLLVAAARRGVDVRILVPGEDTDIPSTRWAGKSFYEEFLQAGIRVYEYQPTMMHAKTIVVDGLLSAVGSLNLDNRSIRLNDESALVVHDARLGAQLDSLFRADLGRAREITLAAHRERGWVSRIKERVYRTIATLL